MTKEFKIENVKAGDMLTASRCGEPIIKWVVLSNGREDDYMGKFTEVYVILNPDGALESAERHSFYHATFKSGAYQKLKWSLESGT
jgi:hypothetical protein